MTFRNLAAATAAASLAMAPVAAQATAAPVERGSASTDASTEQASELRGGIAPALIILALAAIGMTILLVTDDDDEAMSP